MACIDANYSWQPIETAPTDERVMVCGWVRETPNCRGYWWYEEDVTFNGKPVENPRAQYWAPLVIPPFPDAQAIEAGTVKTERLDAQHESAVRKAAPNT